MIAERMSRLGTETAFEVLARARELERQGRHVVHLEIGEPDFDTPAHICEAAIEALRAGHTHYAPSAGIPALREAVAETIRATRGIAVDPENVVITPGAKPIIVFSLLACVGERDEVIYPDTGFPIYRSVIDFIGAKPVPILLREENGFRIDLDEFASLLTDRTRLIILNSPHNPTGGVLTHEDLIAIAGMVRDRDLYVLSDEVYAQILYEGQHQSIASLPGMAEKTIILDGHSKAYAMTGWRLGYGVAPRELVPHLVRLCTNYHSCTTVFVQHAGVAALRGPQEIVRERTDEFRRRRDVLIDGLNAIPGMRCAKPRGAFYALPNVAGITSDCRALQHDLLEHAGVAALAGTSFGANGEGFLRFSYANSVENIRLAVERIGEFVARG
jgi:aspartate/methionine/tyrosine aminotransferase